MRLIVRDPEVLAALNPLWAVRFFVDDHGHGPSWCWARWCCASPAARRSTPTWATSGARPIRLAWFALVFPALLLNYFGQGALPARARLRWRTRSTALVPEALLYPMVALATAATVIASQALISGAFSLTRQAVQLGYFPRVTIVHTSATNEGQIYIPEVNPALMVACIALVLAFKESSALAAAYGIAVTGHDGHHLDRLLLRGHPELGLAARAKALPLVRAVPRPSTWRSSAPTPLKFFDGGWFPHRGGAWRCSR